MVDESSVEPRLMLLEKEKEILEIKKLRRDIAYQKNPFKNPINWAPFATMAGAIVAITWALFTGWFARQNTKLELQEGSLILQQNDLKIDIKRYTADKDQIAESISFLRQMQEDLSVKYKSLDSARFALHN